jgi:hypothetical protein
MRKLYRKRLNEASVGGFSGFGGFGGFGGSGSQPPQQGGPAQPGSVTAAAANGSVSNKSLPLRVNFCKSVMVTHPQTNQKIEMFEALVSNVRYNEESNLCTKLNQFIKSNFGDKTIVATVAEKTSNSKQQNGQQPQKSVIAGFIKLKINPSCINDIMLGWADDIGNFLTSIGYNASTFGKQLSRKIADCPTQADMKVIDDKIGVNFMDLLKHIGDFSIKNKMFSWQVHNYWLREYDWGWVLSRANAMLALGQKPDASFITTEGGWINFNRKIKPGATPIYVYMPDFSSKQKGGGSVTSAPDWAKQKAAQRIKGPNGVRYNTWDEAVKAANGNVQKLHNLDVLAQQIAGISDKHLEKMYDVSDTIPPQNPADDEWANKAGMINNLFGVLNPHAEQEALAAYPEVVKKLGLDKKQQQQQQQQQQQDDSKLPKIDDATQRFFDETLASRILRKWGDYGTLPAGLTAIQVVKNLKGRFKVKYDKNAPLDVFEREIMKIAQEYALKAAPKYGMINPDMQKRVAIATVFAVAALAGYDFSKLGLNNFNNDKLNSKESHAAWSIFSEILPSTISIKNENRINILSMGKKIFFEDHEIGMEGQTMSMDEFLTKTKEIFGPRMAALKSECGLVENKFEKEKKSIQESFVDFYNRLIK